MWNITVELYLFSWNAFFPDNRIVMGNEKRQVYKHLPSADVRQRKVKVCFLLDFFPFYFTIE